MFGYIRPWKPELLVKEWEQYRGVYCGLCRRMGHVTGAFSRLALSYDGTFCAMLLMGLQGGCAGFERRRCVVNPARACSFCLAAEPGERALDFAAALTALLAWQKLRDDWQDGGAGKKLRSAVLFPVFHRGQRRAARKFPRLAELAASYLESQRAAEREESIGLDACAEPPAHLMEEALALGLYGGGAEPAQARALRLFGYHLGRWVYLIDAADDWRADLRAGSFNPFLRRFSLERGAAVSEAQAEALRDYANETLNMSAAQMKATFALLDLPQFAPILRNVVEQGLPQMQRQILFEKKKEN